MNMSLIITEGNYGAIGADGSTCHGKYIIKISSYQYTLQSDLSSYGQDISYGEMVCEQNVFNQYKWSLLCKKT